MLILNLIQNFKEKNRLSDIVHKFSTSTFFFNTAKFSEHDINSP